MTDTIKAQIKKLTEHHRKNCKPYDDICNGLINVSDAEGPYLPVSIFKSLDLCSVPEDQVRRQLTSSGTTGQQVSKIYLDGETAAAQQRALCDIVGEYIGEKRIPMLIIDSPDVLRDRSKYSARGAGIMGFSMMASKRFYALDNDMNPDMDSIKAFAEAADGGPCFAFGFTYMIWQYFCQESSIKLTNCYLIHGGGWKKLQSQAVSNEQFKARLYECWGIEKVSDYYGMAEQTGSIFMECEEGHLHVSKYSDIHILNPDDFSECEKGQWGLIALDSVLPKSYPGHRLLTEDWGRILGDGDCPCGRAGKYFEISGRIKKAEIRGCSDTFAADRSAKADLPGTGIKALAGTSPALESCSESFDKTVLDFINELSVMFTKEPEYRSVPEIYALGFWCRKAHIEKLRSRQFNKWGGAKRKGKGMVLHITPSNMPTMFAYSWISSLLSGCGNIVRLSGRDNEVTGMILDGIRQVMNQAAFSTIKENNAFIQFEHDDEILKLLSERAAARIIWGGDETVEHVSGIPAADGCVDIAFPDKYSIALLDSDIIQALSDDELKVQAHLFYNDTYGADQNACSSPKIIFWRGKKAGQKRWWEALAKEAENYNLEPWMSTEKYRILCTDFAVYPELGPVRKWGNRLQVCSCTNPELFEGKMGMFFECQLDNINKLYPFLTEKIQTVVTNIDGIADEIRASGCTGVDRVVSIGEALDFDTIWDRKDIIDILSE
ncbi:MAG: hypothetical protein MJ144_04095 [Clostridia bacterium]|nr:hypothetical protein [Clostridia bacterium]